MEKFIEDYDFGKGNTSKLVQRLYDCLVDRGVCKEGAEDLISSVVSAVQNEYRD